MVAEVISKMRPIITRKEFLVVTGLDRINFYILVEQGIIRRLGIGRTGKRHRYYRDDAIMLLKGEKQNGH